ncbi:hypothetical protein OC846_006765, partial [Tilletia horrida]
AAEDAKQNEAKDKDAAHERQVDDYDKVLREYKELKEEHARLQHAKSLADKALIEEKDRHERDTADMKIRNDAALRSLEEDLKAAEQNARRGDMGAMIYEVLFNSASWSFLMHKSGHALTFGTGDGKAVLKPPAQNWKQRVRCGANMSTALEAQ